MNASRIDPALQELARACMAAVRGERLEMAADVRGLASRHRVKGLWAYATGDRTGTQDAVAKGLAQLADYREIAAALDHLDPIFLKGLAVAAQGYVHPFLKTSADIDVLVRKQSLHAAAEQMVSLGFDRIVPRGGTDLDAWHLVSNQSVWKRGPGFVELHHQPLPFPMLEPLSEPSRPRVRVEVGGVELGTYAPLDTFAYLCAHGALSGWFRLKWLVDVAALLSHASFTIDEAVEHSRQLKVEDAAVSALVLCNLLFGTPLPHSVQRTALKGLRIRRLVALGLALLQRGEPTERFLGTLSIHESAMWLAGRRALARVSNLIAQRRLR